MGVQAVITIRDLPEAALDAAGAFYTRYLDDARSVLAGEADSLVLVFSRATYDHQAWRRAAIADLARSGTPKRVNGLAGGGEAAVRHTLAWLAKAPGITGQLIPLDEVDSSNFAN